MSPLSNQPLMNLNVFLESGTDSRSSPAVATHKHSCVCQLATRIPIARDCGIARKARLCSAFVLCLAVVNSLTTGQGLPGPRRASSRVPR